MTTDNHATANGRSHLSTILTLHRAVMALADTGADTLGKMDPDNLAPVRAALDDLSQPYTLDDRAEDVRETLEEAAREMALSVEVRTGWHTPGADADPEEYRVLITWGGPACQITGRLGEHGEPSGAEMQVQDWFSVWEPLGTTATEDDAMLWFAGLFYYGDA